MMFLLPVVFGLAFVAARYMFDHKKTATNAHVANEVATVHLEAAATAPSPVEAAAHVAAAQTATQVAAQNTAELAVHAQTDRHKELAAANAALVDANRRVIETTIELMTARGAVSATGSGITGSLASVEAAARLAAVERGHAQAVAAQQSASAWLRSLGAA